MPCIRYNLSHRPRRKATCNNLIMPTLWNVEKIIHDMFVTVIKAKEHHFISPISLHRLNCLIVRYVLDWGHLEPQQLYQIWFFFLEFSVFWKEKWCLPLAISKFLKIWYSMSFLLMKLSRLNKNGPAVVILNCQIDSYLESPEAKNHNDGLSIFGLSVKNCLSWVNLFGKTQPTVGNTIP